MKRPTEIYSIELSEFKNTDRFFRMVLLNGTDEDVKFYIEKIDPTETIANTPDIGLRPNLF